MVRDMETIERRVTVIYDELKEILRDETISPSLRANAIQALAVVWQMVNDLGLDYEMVYDYGA